MEFTHNFKNSHNISNDDIVIVYSGRLAKEKNTKSLVQCLIKTSKSIPNTKVILIGDGPDSKKIQKMIQNENLMSKFILTGFIAHENVISLLKLSHIFVTYSISEVNPVSVIEALKYGLPIVAKNDHAFYNLVINNKNGYIILTETEFIKKL